MRTGLIAIGTAATAAAVGFAISAKASIDALDNLNDLTKSSGLSIGVLSGLALAAKQSGGSLESIAASINKLSRNIGEDGKKFRELGISATDPLEAFKQLADIFNAIEDPQTRAAVAAQALGKSWEGTAPLLAEGSAKIQEMVDRGAKLAQITKEMGGNADEFNDQMAELTTTLEGTRTKLVGDLLPGMNEIARAMREAAKEGGILTTVWVGLGGVMANLLGLTDAQRTAARIKDINDQIAVAQKQLASGSLNPAGANNSFFSFLVPDAKLGEAQLAKIRGTIASLEAERDRLNGVVKPQPGAVFDDEDAGIGAAMRAAEAARNARRFLDEQGKTSTPKTATADNSVERLARAQLQARLDDIRRASDQTISEYQRAENIMSALRAAGIADERDYYEAKLAFVDLNLRAQERRLAQEIAILKAQTFAGKDAALERLANDKQIADLQAKLDKARADAVAERRVLSIGEEGRNLAIARSLDQAKESSEQYIDSIRRRNAAEVAGLGRGSQAREQQAGEFDIEGRFAEQRRRLEGERRRKEINEDTFEQYMSIARSAYAQEVDLYRKRTADILASQRDWQLGAREALQNYYDDSRNIAKATEEVWTRALKGTEDVLTDVLTKGKIDISSLRDLITSVGADLNRQFVKESITGPIAGKLASGTLLSDIGAFLSGRSIATQAAAPVEHRDVAGIIASQVSGSSIAGAAGAVDAGTFTASIAAAGTAFGAEAAAAGVSLSSSISGSGITFNAETIAAATTMAGTLTTAATTFSGIVTAAGTTFASSIATASAGSSGAGLAGSIPSLNFDDFALDSFADGTDYVPRTGLYQLHAGERVLTA
ncbi:MAG: hypothetical protein IT537_30000, partial [Hyphomicrobiales bacterium]|nr:hypothetical protein [Hyphomicrobiales bacterium]